MRPTGASGPSPSRIIPELPRPPTGSWVLSGTRRSGELGRRRRTPDAGGVGAVPALEAGICLLDGCWAGGRCGPCRARPKRGFVAREYRGCPSTIFMNFLSVIAIVSVLRLEHSDLLMLAWFAHGRSGGHRKAFGRVVLEQGAASCQSHLMPMTGYDRDADMIRPAPGPRWRRYLVLAVFVVSMIAGAWLASLASA
jgi:hypothetical protein